jgi:hypothetical protein
MTPRVATILVACSSLVGLCGCQRQFTREHFELIRVGSDAREDVRHMLGKPTADLDDQWLYDDLDQHCTAVIYYDDDGRVLGKQWMDSRTGEWEGRNPHANEPPVGTTRERRKTTTRIDED